MGIPAAHHCHLLRRELIQVTGLPPLFYFDAQRKLRDGSMRLGIYCISTVLTKIG